jgi:putative glutathione S-transferase
MRNLKGLTDLIDISVVHWLMGDDGWTFDPDGASDWSAIQDERLAPV